MQLTPCSGCSLHCVNDNEGPLALKSVGGKLLHRQCLSILPSYRCLQLFHITSHIDLSQQIINLKISVFVLPSLFYFLLGFTDINVPEKFSVPGYISLPPSDSDTTPPPPDPMSISLANFANQSNTTFYI